MSKSDTKLDHIMYTLGEIAGTVFPDGEIPRGIRTTLLSRPRDGLRMIREHENFLRVPIERVLALLDQVPSDFGVAENQARDEHTTRFWNGVLDTITGKEIVAAAASINATPRCNRR
jgi:hypothetical protein